MSYPAWPDWTEDQWREAVGRKDKTVVKWDEVSTPVNPKEGQVADNLPKESAVDQQQPVKRKPRNLTPEQEAAEEYPYKRPPKPPQGKPTPPTS